jgi:hypothetical protein
MSRAGASELISELAKFHNRKISEEAGLEYVKEFAGVSDEMLGQILLRLKRTRSPSQAMPSIDDVSAAMRQIKEKMWRDRKASEPQHPLTKPPPNVNGMGKKALALAARLSPGSSERVNDEELEKLLTEMEAEYPGFGWGKVLTNIKEARETLRTRREGGQHGE